MVFLKGGRVRRDTKQSAPEVLALRHALLEVDQVFTTGLVLQELLQGLLEPLTPY